MLSAARRLAARPQAARALATAVAPGKFDWSDAAARVSGDDAKREVAKLKKLMDDTREMLANQAKVRRRRRRRRAGQGSNPTERRSRRPSGAVPGEYSPTEGDSTQACVWAHPPAGP
jgi:hypothetical protein